MQLTGPAGLTATRIAEAYPGIAGFRTQTVCSPSRRCRSQARRSTRPRSASGRRQPRTTRARARTGAAPTTRARRSSVGDPQAGTWRATTTGGPGEPIEANAEWLDGHRAGGRSLAMVDGAQRPAVVAGALRRPGTARAAGRLDERDVIILGPLEENAHVENPYERRRPPARIVTPGEPFALEPAFWRSAAHPGDAEWQHYAYLTHHRLTPYPKAITFNSNGTDRDDDRSTGAKDDMDIDLDRATIAPNARGARHRDVHPRRRLAGRLGRLASPTRPSSRAALDGVPGSSPRVPRLASSRPCARRSRRCGSACG